jgi:hypothetical protein
VQGGGRAGQQRAGLEPRKYVDYFMIGTVAVTEIHIRFAPTAAAWNHHDKNRGCIARQLRCLSRQHADGPPETPAVLCEQQYACLDAVLIMDALCSSISSREIGAANSR